jgi:hypothetical protein
MMLSPGWGWRRCRPRNSGCSMMPGAPSHEILVLVLQRENITAVGTTPTLGLRCGCRVDILGVTRMERCKSDEQYHIVPSPLAGEGQGEGWRQTPNLRSPPSLSLPRTRAFTPVFAGYGGREPWGANLRNSRSANWTIGRTWRGECSTVCDPMALGLFRPVAGRSLLPLRRPTKSRRVATGRLPHGG